MISERHNSLRQQTWHPSENELLLYADGEMDARSSARVESHLKSCWSCRVKREETDHLISSFMKSRESALGASLNPPSGALLRLQARFDQLDSELGAPRLLSQAVVWFKQCLGSFRRIYWWPLLWSRWTPFLAASALVAFLLFRMSSAPEVSAREILERTEHAEAQMIQKIAAPVVYRKLQLRTRSSAPRAPQTLSWETWTDLTHSRFSQRVEDGSGQRFIEEHTDLKAGSGSRAPSASIPPVLIELQQILKTNRMDSRHPLSASAYQAWRRTLSQKVEQVTPQELPDGNSALTLTTTPSGPFPTDAIVKAELVVRTDDWHPVQQRLQTQGKDEVREFEVTETGFDVLALSAVPASIFADVDPLRAPLTVSPAATPVPLPEVAAPPSPDALIASEIEARFALHRANACLGEALEVTRDRFGVKVQGVVETASRRDQLLESLRVIPLTSAEIQTVEEALKTNAASRAGSSDSEDPQPAVDYTVRSSNSTIQFQESLRRYFADRDAKGSPSQPARKPSTQVLEFSNEAVSVSQLALAEAWALRHLAEWTEANRTAELRPQLKWLLEVMARDHVNALKTHVAKCRNLVEPVLSSITAGLPHAQDSGTPSSPTKDSKWEVRCRVLFSEVEQLDRLVRRLFADTGATGDGEDSVRKVLVAFPSIDYQLAAFEATIAGERSTVPDELSLKDKQP